MGSKGKGSGDKVEGSGERGGGKWGLGIPLSTPPPPHKEDLSLGKTANASCKF